MFNLQRSCLHSEVRREQKRAPASPGRSLLYLIYFTFPQVKLCSLKVAYQINA